MHKQFVHRVEEMLRQEPSSRVLLGVSGGMDSMCMADLFLRYFGAGSFAIAHCNFSLRGKESDGDEALVRTWAEGHGVELFVTHFDTVSYAKKNGLSIEMAARELRYQWFARLCRENGFSALSVAHNANDNAETLMLNLLRGTGLSGLHGMATESCMQDMRVLRPLLEFTRKQIEGYVMMHRVPYRNDSSNFESDYKRNRIRNEVFPIFEKINPSFIRTLNREAGYFAEAGQIVDDWCASSAADLQTCSGVLSGNDNDRGQELCSIDTAKLLSNAHWRYLLYYMLEPYGFNSQTLASIESLLASSRTVSGKRFDSPTHTLFAGRNMLTVCKSSVIAREAVIVVRGEGIYEFNGVRFKVEVVRWDDTMPLKQPEGVLVFDASKLKFPFVCRSWRHGDWFLPLGMRGKKKVSDLFAGLKYGVFEKDSAIMIVDTLTGDLAAQQHVSGVLGIRMDGFYKVTDSTESVIRISLV